MSRRTGGAFEAVEEQAAPPDPADTVDITFATDNFEAGKRGLPVILISHTMPHVWEVADRIHIQRLGRCAGVITPQSHTMSDGVGIMAGATNLPTAEPTATRRPGRAQGSSVFSRTGTR
jgi:ABC-type sugar transport system ATPase subunit